MQRSYLPALLATATLLLSACAGGNGATPEQGGTTASSLGRTGSGSDSPPSGRKAPPAKGSAKVVATVAEDLKSPWGLVQLPEGDLLVSSRDESTITRVDAKTGKKTQVGVVPGVAPGGEGGLMGLALSPSYAQDRLVYAYFTTASDNRIARFPYDPEKPEGEQLGAPDTVFKGIPKASNHDGGRIAFGPDKQLYVGTGEAGDEELAQDKKSLGGKILRMTPEGKPAEGNPDPDSVMYSYGHRNPQGLAWDADNRLWASEFGQDTWDELNLIKPGKNYGWPEVEGKSEDRKSVV